MITTKVKCEICKLEFDKSAREVRRSIKLGTPSICRNKNCKSEWGKITVKRRKTHSKGMNADWMKKINPSKRDKFSPFRNLLHKIRNRKHKNNLTLEDLKLIWDKQNGKCAITGLSMILPETTASTNVGPKCVSIDRIDNTKGYTNDNVQLVCYSANLARNSFSIEDIKEFFKEIGGPCVT